MKKTRRASGLLAALAIIIAYFLLFPHPLGREVTARPSWALALPAAESVVPGGAGGVRAAGGEQVPFRAGSLFGYASRTGKLLLVDRTPFRVALAETGYISYSRLGRDWVLRSPSGERLFSFEGRGYPLLGPAARPAAEAGGMPVPRVFVAKTDLTGLQEVDSGGVTLWTRDFPSMITSVSIGTGVLLAGLLNGSLELVDASGAAAFSAAPAGSRIPVILAAAAAPDGSGLACVSGIDPQLLVVYARRGASFAETARVALPAEFRREVRLTFSPDSRWLAVEGENAVGILDPGSGRLSWTALQGTLAGVAFLASPRAAAFLARAGTAWSLALVAPASAVLLRAGFRAQEASLGGSGSTVLLSVDGKLLCLEAGET